jgi:uncharacterized membrane protein YfcA
VIGIDEYMVAMLVIAVLAGMIGAIVGVGGGILVVPALTLAFGVPLEYAIGASIISTIATSSGSASAYVRDRITNLRVGMFLEIGSVLGSIVGVATTLYIVRSGLSWMIFLVFGSVLLFSAYNVVQHSRSRREESLINQEPSDLARRLGLMGEYEDKSLHRNIRYAATQVPGGLLVTFFAGVLSGLLGVGGGILKVVGMDRMMRLPLKVSTTTSNFMIGVTATASTGILFVNGYVNVLLAAPVALGVVIGSLLGTRVLIRSNPSFIRALFVLVLLAFGVEMIYMGLHP